MDFKNISPEKHVSLFVKSILVFEDADPILKTSLPFFADGYPGLMYQQTDNGLLVNPHKKHMPVLFLYGQTIAPIELEMTGKYQLIVFQLYPFVLKSFFNVLPASINDGCYDLLQLKEPDIPLLVQQLQTQQHVQGKVNLLTEMLSQVFDKKKQNLDFRVKELLEGIIASKGQGTVNDLARENNLTRRTIERRFLDETGLSPKQFSRIIQFASSLEQLSVKDFTKLTDIVYENGFSDQSHFIKVFKAFTGKTPKAFSRS